MPTYWIDINSETDAAVRSLETSMFGGEEFLDVNNDEYRDLGFDVAGFEPDFDVFETDDGCPDDGIDLLLDVQPTGEPQKCSTPDAKRRRLWEGSVQEIGLQNGRVKRPMNAFMIWSQIERRKIAITDPGLHNSVISRVLGQRWQKMSAAERQPFVRRADVVRQAHLQEHPDYRYCPRRREKRKQSHVTHVHPQHTTTTAPPPLRQQPAAQVRLRRETVQTDVCDAVPDVTASGEEEPIRCFRATLGRSLSSAVNKCSFMSSLPSSVGSNLNLKLTIDSSFRAKLKSRKLSRQSSSLSSTTSVPAESTPEEFGYEGAGSAPFSLIGPSADDSGWGSNSNSGSSSSSASSDCNLSMSDLGLDDGLSAAVVNMPLTLTLTGDGLDDQTLVQDDDDADNELRGAVRCEPSELISNYLLMADDDLADQQPTSGGGPHLTNIHNLYNSLTAGLQFDFGNSQLDIDDNSDFLLF